RADRRRRPVPPAVAGGAPRDRVDRAQSDGRAPVRNPRGSGDRHIPARKVLSRDAPGELLMRIDEGHRAPGGARILTAALLALARPGPGASPAAESERTVVIMQTSSYTAYARAAEGVRSELEAIQPAIRVDSVLLPDDDEKSAARGALSAEGALIVAIGTRAAKLARKEARDRPLIYAMVLEPGEIGLPAPGETPRGNATGVAMAVP